MLAAVDLRTALLGRVADLPPSHLGMKASGTATAVLGTKAGSGEPDTTSPNAADFFFQILKLIQPILFHIQNADDRCETSDERPLISRRWSDGWADDHIRLFLYVLGKQLSLE